MIWGFGVDGWRIGWREVRVFDAEGLSGFFPGSEFDGEFFGNIDAGICLSSDGGK